MTAVFTAWNANNLPFVVLRNHERLPEEVDNDLDLLVPSAQLRQAEQLLVAAAGNAGYVHHNRAEFGPLSLFFHDPESLEQIQVDLFTSVAFRLLSILPAREVLERRQKGTLFAIPDPVDEAIVNLCTRLLYHGRVKEKYKPDVVRVFSTLPEVARTRLAASFSPAETSLLVDAVLAEDWSAIEHSAGRLRRLLLVNHLRRQPWPLCRTTARDVRRLLRRWFRPPGCSIALLGPDGSGKSTVIPRVIEGLRFTFPPGKGLLLHWKPVVFGRGRRQFTGVVTDPHGRPPRNPLASLAYFAFHCLEFLIGSITQIHPVRFRNGLVVSDRCYYDFLVDPRRFRLNLPRWVMQLGGGLLPQPDLIFLLDAPTEVLQSRKQEVAAEETQRQRDAFRSVISTLANGHVLDASQPPEKVAEEAIRTILVHLTRRMSRTA